MLLRIELEDDEELVQGVAGAFAVRGRVDGAAVGAVGGDFKFVLGVFVSGSLLAVYSSFSPVDERQETGDSGKGRRGETKGTHSSCNSSTISSAEDFPDDVARVREAGRVDGERSTVCAIGERRARVLRWTWEGW